MCWCARPLAGADAGAAGWFAGGDAVEVAAGGEAGGGLVEVLAVALGAAGHVLGEVVDTAGEVAGCAPSDFDGAWSDEPVGAEACGVAVAGGVGHWLLLLGFGWPRVGWSGWGPARGAAVLSRGVVRDVGARVLL